MNHEVFHVAEGGERLDVFLSRAAGGWSRSMVQKLIAEGQVTVNGAVEKASYRLKPDDQVEITIPPPVGIDLEPEAMPLEIVYEDADLLVVNKPRGMVVHPAAGNYRHTLVNALLAYCGNLSTINGRVRPGIVHRLDKDTSGLLVVAKNDFTHQQLAAQAKEHSWQRIYLALVTGAVAETSGTVDAPIGRHPVERQKMAVNPVRGRPAVTHYRVIERFSGYTLLECRLETGRTHQIRVHLAYLGHPVAGDPRYGGGKTPLGLAGQALHARLLGFVHPRSGEYMEFTAPLPDYFVRLLEELRYAARDAPGSRAVGPRRLRPESDGSAGHG